jgi:arylsulfatase A-like enzyme
MSWRLSVGCVLGLASVVALPGGRALAQAAGNPPQPRNVLLLLSDDQRHDTIHALGNEVVRTPNLDRLAQRGFVFRNARIMGAMQGAVCVPSRAMLHTGRALWRAPENLQGAATWAETFRAAGYATWGTGKWHNGQPSFARGFQQGRAVFFGGMSDHLRVPVQDLLPDGGFSPRQTGAKFSSELFADTAIELLRAQDGRRPFFLSVAFTAPHDPRMPPAECARLYDPDKMPLPENFLPEHPFDNGELRVRDELLAPHPRTPDVVRRHIAEYYGMITHLDAQIGRVLEALKAAGHEHDTLVIFAGDNGLAVGQHGLLGKQSLYEHSVRVPLIVAGPGIAPGRSDALVYLLDVFPTACDYCGVALPPGVDGKSLLPLVRGEAAKVRDFAIAAYRNLQRSICEPRWKLIQYHVGGVKTAQLFDLRNDPWERHNLAADPAHAAEAARLARLLAAARREAGDAETCDMTGGKASIAAERKGSIP